MTVAVVDGRKAEQGWVLRERDGTRAHGRGALYLRGRQRRVPERNECERDVPAGRAAAPLFEHPVVVSLNAEESEIAIGSFVEHLPAKPWERREAQRRKDTGAVHVVETRHGVVAPGPHLVVGDRLEAELL